jgi:hypothetical protein
VSKAGEARERTTESFRRSKIRGSLGLFNGQGSRFKPTASNFEANILRCASPRGQCA